MHLKLVETTSASSKEVLPIDDCRIFFLFFSNIYSPRGEYERLNERDEVGEGGGGVSILSSFMPHKLR